MDHQKKRGRPAKTPEIKPTTSVTTSAVPVQVEVIPTPPEPVTIVNVASVPEKKYDYKIIRPTVAMLLGTNLENKFDELGSQGYLFIGESAGCSIFVKPIG